jgi:chromosome segregation ATPase
MKLLVFLLVIFVYLPNIVHAMLSCGDADYTKRYASQNQTKKVFLPSLSDVEISMNDVSQTQQVTESQPSQLQIKHSFQNQTASYKNYGHDYFESHQKYRKRKFSSQSDIGPITDKIRIAINHQSQPKFVKRKKTIHRSISPAEINFSAQYNVANYRVEKNDFNQNFNNVNSPNNTDNTIDDLRNQPSPVTEIVDLPSDRSLTPTVVIEPQLPQAENSAIVTESTSSYLTSVLTKSQWNQLQTPKPTKRQIEKHFTDQFGTFFQKNSEICTQISQQTENFGRIIQSFDPKKDDLNTFQFTIDDNLFQLRKNIRSAETLAINNIQKLNGYIFRLTSRYSQCKNENELLHIKSVVSTMKDMTFENLIRWAQNSMRIDNQIQNMHSALLEISQITKNNYTDNLITRPHIIGISREILGFKEEITNVLSSLFGGLDTWNRNLDQITSQLSDDENNLKSENQRLKESQNLFRKQSDDLIKKLQNVEANFDKLQKKYQRKKEQAEKIYAERNFFKQENERLRKERKISHQQLDNLLSNLEYLKKSQKKLEQLKPTFQKAERIFHENTLLKETNKNLTKERNTLKKRSNDLLDKLNGLKMLQGEFTSQQNEIQITKETLEKIRKEKKLLELENQNLRNEKKALQQQLNNLPKTLESIISKNKSNLQTQEDKVSKSPVTNRAGDNNLFEYRFQINSNHSNNSKFSIRNIIN